MGPRHVAYREARPGVEGLELRIAPAIVAVDGGGNTPAEVLVVGGSGTGAAGGGHVLTGVSHSAADTSYE